jgi:hypothetical protein
MISEINKDIIIRTTNQENKICIQRKLNAYLSITLPLPIPTISSFLPSNTLIKFLGVTV